MDSEKRSNDGPSSVQKRRKCEKEESIKKSPAAVKNSVPVSIPLTMICNGDQIESIMKKDQAVLGKHKLPIALPPQREPYKLQPQVRPKPPPSKVNRSVQTEINIKSSETNLIRLNESSPPKAIRTIKTDQLEENITEKEKTAATEQENIIRQENLAELGVQKKLAEQEKFAERVKPADAPTSVENQSDGNDQGQLEKQLEDLSNFNKKQLLQVFHYGVNAGKLFTQRLALAKKTKTSPEPKVSDPAPATEQTGEEKISRIVKSEVMRTLKELVEVGAIKIDWSKINNPLPPAPVDPTQKRDPPPVPPLKKMRSTRGLNPASPGYNEAYKLTAPPPSPAASMHTATCMNPFQSPSERNYGNALPPATPENQLAAARMAPSNVTNVHMPGQIQQLDPYYRPVPMAQHYAQQVSPEYRHNMDLEYRLRQYQLMQEQAAQRSGYPNTQWSNHPRKH